MLGSNLCAKFEKDLQERNKICVYINIYIRIGEFGNHFFLLVVVGFGNQIVKFGSLFKNHIFVYFMRMKRNCCWEPLANSHLLIYLLKRFKDKNKNNYDDFPCFNFSFAINFFFHGRIIMHYSHGVFIFIFITILKEKGVSKV